MHAEQARIFDKDSELWAHIAKAPEQMHLIQDYEDFHSFITNI
jgi:hypothetical protein